MDTVEDKLLEWVKTHGLLDGVRRLLPAVSGGADSAALAHLLVRLKQRGRLSCELVIGHVNHGLRGDASDGDERFVAALGERLGVRVVSQRADVRGYAAAHRLSIETAGRVLRIRALTAMAREHDCDAIATGHHGDDQAETMVHRLMRGTGLRGLCGIRPSAMLEGVRFVRPLLGVRRAEIEAYCRANGAAWREDASNRSCAFTRNRIRHRLMPELPGECPDAVVRLTALAEACLAAQLRIEAAADGVTLERLDDDRIGCDRAAFAAQSPWTKAELCSRAVQALGGGLRDLTSRHYRAIMADAPGRHRTKVNWPGNITVETKRNRILFSRPAEGRTDEAAG